jgi:hypothetical protein
MNVTDASTFAPSAATAAPAGVSLAGSANSVRPVFSPWRVVRQLVASRLSRVTKVRPAER